MAPKSDKSTNMVEILLFLFLVSVEANPYSLKQVLVLGRHNIRAPLVGNLERFTPKEWPKWNVTLAYLTPKGALLEEYMGEYFKAWLEDVGFLPRACLKHDEVFLFANTPQRTVETATIFTNAAFKNCNFTVHHKMMNTVSDPVFNPIIHNTTEAHKNKIVHDMKKKLNELDLKGAYLELNRILDVEKSEICRKESICDLTSVEDKVFYKVLEEPNVIGPLAIGNSVVDSILMEYYSGVPLDSIAWGHIREENIIETLTDITKANQNVRFNITSIAKDVAKPLIRKMFESFLNNQRKFTLLVGHDSNLSSVTRYLNFKPYELPNSYEKTPIGGKIVFQKWHDKEHNRDLLKVNYVYQNRDQLRNGAKLSLANPPNWVVMEMEDCHIDNKGYCLWDDFVNMLKNF